MELSVFSVTHQILHTYQVWATFLGFLGDSSISTDKDSVAPPTLLLKSQKIEEINAVENTLQLLLPHNLL